MLEYYPHLISPLESAGFKHKEHIKQLYTNPSIIVRTSTDIDPSNMREIRKLAQLGRILFAELSEKSGLALPNINYVLSDGVNSTLNFFTITDRVYGSNLDDLEYSNLDSARFQNLYDRFYQGLFNYYGYKYQQGGDFLMDIVGKQCVWGKRKDDSDEKLYLVDLDIHNLYFDKSTGEGEEELLKWIDIVYGYLSIDEKNRFQGTRLANARRKLEEVLLQINPKTLKKNPELQEIAENIKSNKF